MRSTVPLTVILTLCLPAGCRSYAPRPLDLDSHAAAWRDRRADDATVMAFVRSLRGGPGEAGPAQEGFDFAGGVDLQHAEMVALAYNADLRLARADRAAEERLRLEIRRQYPDLTLGPQYENESNQSRVGFIAGVPLPILNANRQGIAEAEANRDRARAEFETAYERIVGRLMALRRLRSAARLEQSQIESRLAPLIDRQVGDARQLLDIGEGSPLALLEGIVRRHDAKRRALQAIAAEADADIELARLSGGGDALTVSPSPTTTRQDDQP